MLDEVLPLDGAQRATLTLLLLRGAQTPGELRSRSERLHAFTGLGEVESALAGLRDRDEPLVRELPRQPGHKEQRWIHLLGPVPEPSTAAARTASPPAGNGEVERLRAELAAAKEEIARLQQELEDLTAP